MVWGRQSSTVSGLTLKHQIPLGFELARFGGWSLHHQLAYAQAFGVRLEPSHRPPPGSLAADLGLHNHVNQLLISLCCTREPRLTLLNLNEPGSPRGDNSRKKHYSLLTWEGSGKRPMSLTVLYQSKKGRLQVTETDATCYSVYWKAKSLPSTVFHPLVKPLQSFLVLQLRVKTQLPILAPTHINRQANFPRLSSFFWDSWIVAIKQS